MDPVTLIVVPGFLGGIVVALVVIRLRQRPHTGAVPADAYRVQPLSTDVINMAHIRVAGIGGLGLVAMAVCVALFVPRIRQSIALALVLGVLFALVLIMRRRTEGPMSSSGRSPGANTTLSIDAPAAGEARRNASGKHRHDLEATPHLA